MTSSLNFQFIKSDGSPVTGSFNIVPTSYPIVEGNYTVDGEPLTLNAPITQSLINNYFKVELNNSTTNDWYIYPAGIYPYAAYHIYSGSFSTGSLVDVVFSMSNHVLNTESVNKLTLKPVYSNTGFNNAFVTEESLSYVPINGVVTASLVPQPYYVTLKGDKRNTKFTISVPVTSSVNSNEIIVTTSSVATPISPVNSALFGYTAQASDARYLIINNSGSAVSSSYALTSSYANSTDNLKNGGTIGSGTKLTVGYSQPGGYEYINLLGESDEVKLSIPFSEGKTVLGGEIATASLARTASLVEALNVGNNYAFAKATTVGGADVQLKITNDGLMVDISNGISQYTFDESYFTAPNISASQIEASGVTGSLQGTASWAVTASHALNAGNTLSTGSTYPITASWAESAKSASFVNASVITGSDALIKTSLQIGEGSSGNTITPGTAMLVFSNRINAASFGGPLTGSVQGTASWATNCVTSSYVETTTIPLVVKTNNSSGNSQNISISTGNSTYGGSGTISLLTGAGGQFTKAGNIDLKAGANGFVGQYGGSVVLTPGSGSSSAYQGKVTIKAADNVTHFEVSTTGVNMVPTTGSVGINAATPSAKLHVIDTNQQLRVGYNVSNYFTVTVASDGGTTFDAVGGGSFNFSDNVNVTGNISCSAVTASAFTANNLLQMPYSSSTKALTPVAVTGSMYLDATNNAIYIYNGSTWKTFSIA